MRTAMLAVLGLGCAQPPLCALPEPEPVDRPNLLLVVVDDVGIDQLAPWGVGADPVPTPTLDCLCDRGLRFDQAWAAPLCSPARAALLSGRHARRDGLGKYLNVSSDTWELPSEHRTVAEALAPVGYQSAFLGKWHVATFQSPSGLDHPNVQGFDHFAGTLGNLAHGTEVTGKLDFETWEHLENGAVSERRGYVTSATVDDALDAMAELPEPWLVVVSLHAPHAPLHVPPASLTTLDVPDEPSDSDQYRLMLQAADTELGRLLRTVDPAVLARTQIWTTSDNGTPSHGILPPQDPRRGKGTLYEGGLRVPLVVTGAGVSTPGEVSRALVSLVDLLPTFTDVGGVLPLNDLDGRSLVGLLDDPTTPHHDTLYADVTRSDGQVDRAIRGPLFKVVEKADGTSRWFAVGAGLHETELSEPSLAGSSLTLDAMEQWVAELEP